MNMAGIWMNGKLLDEKHAMVSVNDRGFLYGDAVFETMRSYAGVVFKIDSHLERLSSSLKVMRIRAPYSIRRLKDAIYKVLGSGNLKSAYVRLTITRGEGSFAIGRKAGSSANVIITARALDPYPDDMHRGGVSVKLASARQNELSPVAGIKSANYLNFILARLEAKKSGFDEAVLMNTKGRVAEAASSNIFLVRKGAILTPSVDSGILPGITRGVILGIARELGLAVKEKTVYRRELLGADEVFLTNSIVEVLPVTRIGSYTPGGGYPGEITKLVYISYQKKVIREVTGRL